ncbi:MAG: hypothetical protein ACLU8C_07560 [Lacrimispora saccharolytica]
MTKAERRELERKQEILMRRYNEYEAMQRDFSYDPEFYSYAERQMQKLNDETEYIRGLLEGRWNE